MACPLCDDQNFKSSWLGTTFYNDKEFEYVECRSCKSLYCNPMPDAETLTKMYGVDYYSFDSDESNCSDPADRFDKPLDWLKQSNKTLFLDYGCGSGELLESAAKLGWQISGVEFDPEVAERVSRRLNAKIVTNVKDLGEGFQANVLHLGDVIEHLTDLKNQMPEILELLKPGGFLLAQGPLEANTNLFTSYLKYSRKIRGKPRSEMPPYHVLLATANGQRDFFKRFGLKEIKYEIDEISHPAPENISVCDISHPQKVGMFAVRRVSQLISSLNSKKWGNRYFYVGQLEK